MQLRKRTPVPRRVWSAKSRELFLPMPFRLVVDVEHRRCLFSASAITAIAETSAPPRPAGCDPTRSWASPRRQLLFLILRPLLRPTVLTSSGTRTFKVRSGFPLPALKLKVSISFPGRNACMTSFANALPPSCHCAEIDRSFDLGPGRRFYT